MGLGNVRATLMPIQGEMPVRYRELSMQVSHTGKYPFREFAGHVT